MLIMYKKVGSDRINRHHMINSRHEKGVGPNIVQHNALCSQIAFRTIPIPVRYSLNSKMLKLRRPQAETMEI